MTTAATAQASETNTPRGPRTRLQPMGGSGKSVYVMLVCLGLCVLGAVSARWYSKGAIVYISSNAYGANVLIDRGDVVPVSAQGAIQYGPLPYGPRTLRIFSQDYQPLMTTINVGWFSGNRFTFKLQPIPLTLTVNTNPGAEIILNGQSAGTANNEGILIARGVLPGDYQIEGRLPGYSSFQVRRHLSPPSQHMFAGLSITPERIHQVEEEHRRAQENASSVQQLVGSAQQQFTARQYNAALATVDEALRLDPASSAAQQLKAQIVQTISILK